jgi:hypothetical protein
MLMFGQFFWFVFFFQFFFGGIKTILPKWGEEKKNEETTEKNAGHLRVFCFRISRQLVSHLAMTKRKRNCAVFISRYSEYSTYTKGGAATRKFLPQSCRERKKRILESSYWNGNKANGIAMINFLEKCQTL